MPANSQDSTQGDDGEAVQQSRMDWRDYSTAENRIDEDRFEKRQRVFDPGLQPTRKQFGEIHQILKEEERSVINHAPGRSEQNQSTRLATRDKFEITGRLCGSLDLHYGTKREAQRIMVELNLDKFGNQKRIAKIALVVIRYVTDQIRLKGPQDYPKRIAADERYMELIAEQGMDLGDVMRLSSKLKQELRRQEVARDG